MSHGPFLSSDGSSRNSLVETSCSDSVFEVQDGDCNSEDSGTPPVDLASLNGLDVQSWSALEKEAGDEGSGEVLKDGEAAERSFSQSE